MFSYDSAPLSASLLSDWSEVHRMTPADLESLQQELQLGSPMILSDTIPPDAWRTLSWDNTSICVFVCLFVFNNENPLN